MRLLDRLLGRAGPGRDMGSYELVERLGIGGMGEVWTARHRMLARPAAVKLIRPVLLGAAQPEEARQLVLRFEREARATAALRSPHTIEIYDYGTTRDGTFFLVVELLPGYNLETLVRRFGPVPPERAVFLLKQACRSLAEAHASGLVHRDVKPANIYVSLLGIEADFVKVLDFGLVKDRRPSEDGLLTLASSILGTPAYLAPEIALGTGEVDGRADLYGLGCVAYWLLTGRQVFRADSTMQMVVEHVRTAPDPPSAHAPGVSAPLDALVLRCLAKQPDDRPGSSLALLADLEALHLQPAWDEERARAWWTTHAQDGGAAGEAALPSLPTLSAQARGLG
jgi:serine/threonine-protein kinase